MQLKTIYGDILRIFFSMKNKIILNQSRQLMFGVTTILIVKVMVIEIKHYQLKNILTKLDRI